MLHSDLRAEFPGCAPADAAWDATCGDFASGTARRSGLNVRHGGVPSAAYAPLQAVSARRPKTLILPGAVRRKQVSVVRPSRQR